MSFLNRIFGSKKKKGLEKFEFNKSNSDYTNNKTSNESLIKDQLGLPQNDILQQQDSFNPSLSSSSQQNSFNDQNNFESFNEMRQHNFVENNRQTYGEPELVRIQKELEVISSKIETLKVLLENINQRLYVLENQQNARRF